MEISRRLKAAFRKPFKLSDLTDHQQKLLSDIRLPDGLEMINDEEMQSSLRVSHTNLLKRIAEKETWSLQRRRLLEAQLVEANWRSFYRVAKDSEHPETWKKFVEGISVFDQREPAEWLPIVTKRYLFALMNIVWLHILGKALYQLPETKEVELGLIIELDFEAKKLEIETLELIHSKVIEMDFNEAAWWERAKKDAINPLIEEYERVITEIKGKFLDSAVDPDEAQRELDRVRSMKAHLLRALRVGGN